MSDDIFHSWKNSRFVVTDHGLLDSEHGIIVVLTDLEYWNNHYEELREWCYQHCADVRGMTVTCDEPTLTLFALRWS